jgi:L-ribulose-5-phosphate 3-epimerase UlaE
MLALSGEVGYDYFEISIDRTDKRIDRLYNSEIQDELEKTLKHSHVKIGSICLSALGTYTLGNPDESNRQKALDIFKHAILFAERFNIPILQIPACDVPKFDIRTKQSDSLFLDGLSSMIEYASIHNVLVGLENMENDYMDSVRKCMRAISKVASPYFQLYPDAGNLTSAAFLSGETIEKDMFSGKGHYCAFHLKETRPNKYGGLFYGEGHVDFSQATKFAWELGVRRFVMEYWYTGNPEWLSDLKRANKMCRHWVEKAIKENGTF